MHCMQTTWYGSGHSKRTSLRANQQSDSRCGRRETSLTCTDDVLDNQLCLMQYSTFALPFCQHIKGGKKKCTVLVVIYGLLEPAMLSFFFFFTFLWIYLASCCFFFCSPWTSFSHRTGWKWFYPVCFLFFTSASYNMLWHFEASSGILFKRNKGGKCGF